LHQGVARRNLSAEANEVVTTILAFAVNKGEHIGFGASSGDAPWEHPPKRLKLAARVGY